MTTPRLSELQGLGYLGDVRRRRYLLGQLAIKRRLEAALGDANLNPIQELNHLEALRMVDNNIQKMRVAGLL